MGAGADSAKGESNPADACREAAAWTVACGSPKRCAPARALGFVCGAVVLGLQATSATLIGDQIASLGEALRFWAAGHMHKRAR